MASTLDPRQTALHRIRKYSLGRGRDDDPMNPLTRFALLIPTVALLAGSGCSEPLQNEQAIQDSRTDPCVALRAEKAELLTYTQGLTDPAEIQRARRRIQDIDTSIKECEGQSRSSIQPIQ